MHAYRSSRTLPRIGAAFATSLTLLALSGDPARAAGASLYGEGLHIASRRPPTAGPWCLTTTPGTGTSKLRDSSYHRRPYRGRMPYEG